MPKFKAKALRTIAFQILNKAGATKFEARTVADALVQANLEGHDSHGVVRVPQYVAWVEKKLINIGAQLQIDKETPAFALINGNWGWGQVVARQAMEIGIQKASRVTAATISVHRCNHLGRVGDYPLVAAQSGMAAIMFVNNHGGGKTVAPWGGRDRRLSPNPIAIALPRSSGHSILVDISTCAIAGGKITVARNSKKSLPPGCIVDSHGLPSINPADFFGPPEGALLPFGGHKGFALGLATDILAGALSGAGCSSPSIERVGNSFTAMIIDVAQVRDRAAFDHDVARLVEYVKTSRLADGYTEILIPGELEMREREKRKRNGISIDQETWRQITETASRYGMRLGRPE